MSLRVTAVIVLALLSLPFAFAQRNGSRSAARNPGPANLPPTAGVLNSVPSGTTSFHADDEKRVEFRTETVLVQVPVVVADKSGKHLRGLKQTDFELFENGKQQKIQFFDEIEPSSSAISMPGSHPGELANLSGTSTPHSVTIIALDTINTPYLDQFVGRKELIKYLAESLNPDGQAISLVSITGRGLKVLHNFTSDPKILIDALKKVNAELPLLQGIDSDTEAEALSSDSAAFRSLEYTTSALNPRLGLENSLQDFVVRAESGIARMQQDRAIELTMRAFLNIGASVSGIPGRKSLIWATGGFPFYMDSRATVPGGYLSLLYERAMQSMNESQIAVYPVDVRGLITYAPTADASYSPGNAAGTTLARSQAARSWLQNAKLDTLRDFAEMTGGRAFYNTNDLAGGFKRAAEDSSSYYLLAYHLDTRDNKPGWRHLKVKVHAPGSEARARDGFFVTNAAMNPEISKRIDIENALASPFDSTGMGLTARWQGTTPEGAKRKIAFAVAVTPDNVTIETGERSHFSVEFVALASKNGIIVDTFSQNIEGTPGPETLARLKAAGLSYSNYLQLPSGEYSVRFLMRDNLSGKVGTVSGPLSVQ